MMYRLDIEDPIVNVLSCLSVVLEFIIQGETVI